MKRHYLAAILAVMCIFMSHAIVELDEAHFPDPNFRKFITQKTKVKEGIYPIIFDDVIANQKVWYLDGLGIKDLTGIEYFTSLTYLSCDNNLLTSLDVSKLTQLESLSCANNYLSSLDVTHNTKLFFLGCESNNLFDLDVSKCPDLLTLYLRNNHLIQLDLSKINGNNGLEGVLDKQSREMPAPSFTDIDGKKKYKITMPDDFVNDKSTLNYIKEITTPGVTSEIVDGVTYFYIDADNRPDKVSYKYATGNIMYPCLEVDLTPLYRERSPMELFTLSETHRSKFLPNKALNTYKNTITLNNIDLSNGATYTVMRTPLLGGRYFEQGTSVEVATVKLSLVKELGLGSHYEYSVTYPDGSLTNDVRNADRFDHAFARHSGRVDDGVVVVDYFTADTGVGSVYKGRMANGGDQAGPYKYSIAGNAGVMPVTVPVYVDDTEAYLVSDQEKWSRNIDDYGYDLSDIIESDKEWNPNENSPFNTPQGVALGLLSWEKNYDKDEVKSYTAYVNNKAIQNNKKDDSRHDCYVDLESLNDDLFIPINGFVYRCAYSVNVLETQNGEIVENTYGSNTVEVGTVSLSTTPSELIVYDEPFDESSYYYRCSLETKVNHSVSDFHTVQGIRVWRNCDRAYEVHKELKDRSQHHLFYENFNLENPTFISNIGIQESDPSITLGTHNYNGVFGFKKAYPEDTPEVQYRIRVYYKGNRKVSKYHVAEEVVNVKFPVKIPTGIDGVDCDKQVKSVSYYNNLGQMSDKPFNGMNIIVTTYTDGSHSSTKMIK